MWQLPIKTILIWNSGHTSDICTYPNNYKLFCSLTTVHDHVITDKKNLALFFSVILVYLTGKSQISFKTVYIYPRLDASRHGRCIVLAGRRVHFFFCKPLSRDVNNCDISFHKVNKWRRPSQSCLHFFTGVLYSKPIRTDVTYYKSHPQYHHCCLWHSDRALGISLSYRQISSKNHNTILIKK